MATKTGRPVDPEQVDPELIRQAEALIARLEGLLPQAREAAEDLAKELPDYRAPVKTAKAAKS